MALAVAWSAPASAQLTGGSVVAGKATISRPSATSTLITQTSPTAILTWNGFSIPHGSSVTFLQPSASAIALNRVLGGSPSFLFGSLSANGQVWLINPAGIVVGSGGTISAAGALLSTADIHNADFLRGNYSFDIPGNAGAGILNRGTITAGDGGSVVLAGAHVTNDGLIAAELGSVVVAGASTYAVDFAGDGLLSFAITSGSAAAGTLVDNKGKVSARGGLVLLTAQAATSVLDNVINTSGIVEATSAANVNGKIVLTASGGGTAVSGTLDASGKGAGQTGGTVEVLGDSVTLASGAKIDVSGDAGGGTALVGGNFHGAGPEANAATTTVAAGSIIDADAITSGDGGKVAVWSDDATTVAGSISARGGAQGGDGGYLETSGGMLAYAGITVDLSAAHGQAGTWLLDPYDLDVTGAGAATLAVALGSNNIVVETGQFSAGSAFGTVNTAGNGDITILTAITWNSGNSLTLSAYRNIAIDASITNTSAGIVTLQADNTGTGTGTVTFNGGAKINTTGAVSIYYNPASYSSPTTYTGDVSTPASLTAYMLVNDFNDLQNISTNLSGTYALGTSIFINPDVNSNFTPLGTVASPFTGTFDGRGMIVDSLTMFSSLDGSTGDIGLFGDTSGATIRNIGLTNVLVTATDESGGVSVGALIGHASNTTISNAYSTGSISADSPQGVGGLVGASDSLSSISNSNSATAINTGSGYAGGLVGSNDGLVTNSYSTSFVSVGTGDDGAGGLVGDNDGQVQLSFAAGEVFGPYAGGLVGVNFNGGTINQSYATGTVSPTLTGGGLVGYNDGTVSQSYATGNVTTPEGCDGDCTTGGLVGENDMSGSIDASYALGGVSVDGQGGGLVGENDGAITQSYEVGSVTGNGLLGALIGFNSGTADALTFWDTDNNSSPSPLPGIGSGLSVLATGMTTAQLTAGVPGGYDTSVWAQNSDGPSGSINGDGNLGIGFPYLQWSLQTVSGTAFSDRGVTVLPNAPLNFYVDGELVGRGNSISDGTYSAEFAGSGPEFIVVIAGATPANTFYDGLVGTPVSGVDLYGGYVRLISGAGSFTSIVDNLGVAQGSNYGGNFYFNTDGSLLTVDSGMSLEVDSFGNSLVLDEFIDTGTANLALGSFGGANPLITQIEPFTATDLLLNGPIGAPPSPGYGNIGNYVLTDPGNDFAAIGAATQSLDVVDSAALTVVPNVDDSPSFVSATGAIVLASAANLTLPAGTVLANTDTVTFQAAGTVSVTSMATDGGGVIITANSGALGSPLNGSIIADGINTASATFGTVPGGTSGGFVTLELAGGGSGTISLTGNITAANSAVTFSGPTVLNDSSGPVLIDTTNAMPTAAGATVTFSNSIDNVATPVDGLTITAGTTGTVVFDGTIGATTPIGALTVTAAGVSLDAGNITTLGAVTFNAAVTLPGFILAIDTTGNGTTAGANVAFGSSIDGTTAGGQSLTIDAGTAGTISFTGGVGTAMPLGQILLTDADLDIGPGIGIHASNGNFLQSGATVLEGGALTLTDTVSTVPGNGEINFSGPIDGTGSGNQALTLKAGAGPLGLEGALGGSTPLGAVTISAGIIGLGANITTNGGAITFNAPVKLLTSVVLNANSTGSATGGAAVTFNSTLDDSTSFDDDLTITAGSVAADANVNFAGRVGEDQNGIGTSLGAVTIEAADAVNMTMPFGANGDGFSVGSLVISPGAGAPGAATLTTSSYIDTNTGGTGGAVNIVTTGNVAVGLDIFTSAGSGGPSGATGGAVTINAGGSVSVGAGIPLTSTGSGTSLSITSPRSIETSGESPVSLGQNAGNGGAVTITGTSIALPQGMQANGGDALVAGSTNNGGNGGLITLNATAGNVTVGSAATGPQIALKTRGGDSLGGSGGDGGGVLVTATTMAFSGIDTEGGDTAASVGVTGGIGGNIILTSSATSGAAVTLYGNATSTASLPISPTQATLITDGGLIGDSLVASNGLTGTVSGDGGNISILGNTSGLLLGSSFIALTSSTAPALNGGPTVVAIAEGKVGGGGEIDFDGPVQATTANVESLVVDAANGVVGIVGPVGSSVPLNTVAIGFVPNAIINITFPPGSTDGNAEFENAVTADTQFVDQRTSGTLTLDAALSTPPPTFDLTTAGGPVTFDAPVLLSGNVDINTTSGSPAGATVTFANTVNGATAFADGLTVTAGTAGNVVFSSPVGASVTLGPASIAGENINLTMAANGFNAASFTANGASLSETGSFLSTAGSQTGGSQTNGGAIDITTTGAVAIGGSIFAEGGVTAGGVGGNGGAITINAGGAVSIGTGLSLTTSGSGATLLQTDSSVFAAGFDATTSSQTAGNGGAISITGSSINLPLGVFSRGGEEELAGSTNAGGNAGTLALTATAGSVTVGIPNVTGNAVFASAGGGDSPDGPVGNGAAATITGSTISLANLHTNAGASAAASGPAASGGDITLIATAASGPAITLYGEADSPTAPVTDFITLSSRGSVYGATQIGTTSYSGGTITGPSGNISIGGGPGGAGIPVAPLFGSSFVELVTGAPTSLNGGATVEINGSAPVSGGIVFINGPIEGASADVQNLHLRGNITVVGPIGNLVALNTLSTGTTNPAAIANATFESSVDAATEIDILAPAGSVTFEGMVTTADFMMTAGTTTLGLLGGTDFTGTETFSGGAIEIEGPIDSAGLPVIFSTPIILEGATTIDTTNGGSAPGGAAVTFASTLDGAATFVDNLTITAGAGAVTFDGRVGADAAGIGTSLGAVGITTTGAINLAMTPGSNNDGFAAASITMNGGSLTATSYLDTNGAISSVLPSNGGAIHITTTGNVAVDGEIAAAGGLNTSTGAGGNGGNVTVNAGGAVSIGTTLTLTTSGSGVTLAATDGSVYAPGFTAMSNGQTPGNGATISITGTSINLPVGVGVGGGAVTAAGSVTNGGAGGTVTLTATAGGVTVGMPTGAAATGNVAGINTSGGSVQQGSGGNAGPVSISGQTITLGMIDASGGDSGARTGNEVNGASITLIGTATSGAAVTLYGDSDAPGISGTNFATLQSRAGKFTNTDIGAGGNITIEGSAGGAVLNGTSFIQLATSTAGSFNGGSTVLLTADSDFAGIGGTISVRGPIEATTANVENLDLRANNGNIIVTGPIGNQVALNTLTIGAVTAIGTSAATFDSSVTAGTEIIDLRTDSRLAIDGAVTTGSFDLTAGMASVSLLGGGQFSAPGSTSGAPVTAAGTFVITGTDPGLTLTGPLTLAGTTTFNTSAVNGPITLANVDGTFALNLIAGGGTVTLNGEVGTGITLTSLNVTGGTIALNAPVTTFGSQTYIGAITIGPTAASSVTLTAGSIGVTGTIDGPGALTLIDGPPTPDILVTGSIGATVPLASLTINGSVIELGSVTTDGSQSYTDSTLVLTGSNYQTDGTSFTEMGATIAEPISGETINIDTTGSGQSPVGGNITFTSPGTIDAASPVSLNVDPGSAGTVNTGLVGGSVGVTNTAAPPISSTTSPPPPIANTALTTETPPPPPPPPPPPTSNNPPPPPPPPGAEGGGPESTPGGPGDNGTPVINQVTDLDSGSTDFTTVTGSNGDNGSPPEPFTIIAPITQPTQPTPQPVTADTVLGGPGSHLFIHSNVYTFPPGVPGITNSWPTFGNRGLWFTAQLL